MEVQTWNLQGRSLDNLNQWLEVPRTETMDIVVLQEVGGIHRFDTLQQIPGGTLKELLLPEDSELSHYHVIGAVDVESHLSQVMLLDKDVCDCVHWACSGKRIVELCFRHVTLNCDILLVGVHFPHKNDPDEVFQEALWELEHVLGKSRRFHLVCVAGDWNTQAGDARHNELLALTTYYGYLHMVPERDTWYRFGASRCYDYFFFKDTNVFHIIPESANVDCNLDAMHEIKTDHALVTSSFQVFASVSKDPLNKRKKGCFKRCFRWRIDAQIDEVLPHIWDPHIRVDATSQWQTLRALSNAVSTRKVGLRYVDPPFVKDLCKQRREVTDSAQRAWIVRAIFACRTAAKREWWKQLENAAGNGDSEAICYLRRRQRKPASTTAFARDSGGRSKAAERIRAHTLEVFCKPVTDTGKDEIECMQLQLWDSSANQLRVPFGEDEIKQFVMDRVRRNKTSGMSGISAELLHAMVHSCCGLEFLAVHCNTILETKQVPQAYLQAFVCLVPKEVVITVPKQYRPLCLLEAVHKLLSGMLYQRLITQWEKPTCQLGALPGSQAVECLWMAQTFLYKEYKTGTPSLWLLLDIKQAFDNLNRKAVLDLFLCKTPEAFHHEALLLWKLLQCDLHFCWDSEEWSLSATTGVQQGAPPSAGIFSLIIGNVLQELFHSWAAGGITFQHKFYSGDPVFGWAYVDDVIIDMQDWESLRACFTELIEGLALVGLQINFDKTVIVVPEHLWADANRFASREPEHPLCKCKWQSEGQYLRKPFKPFLPATSLSQWVVQSSTKQAHSGWHELSPILRQCRWHQGTLPFVLINRYIFAKFSWFIMMMEPLTEWTRAIDNLQCTLSCLALQLFVPGNMKEAPAMALHRLRRRLVHIFLQLHPHLRWVFSAMKRRWHYLGHLLRRQPQAMQLSIIHASMPQEVTQAVPAPWNSAYSWIVGQMQRLTWVETGNSKPSLQQLRDCASDRDAWAAQWEKLNDQYCIAVQLQHPFNWSRVREAFQTVVAWKLSVAVFSSDDAWWLTWLNNTEGACCLQLSEDFLSTLTYVRMGHPDVWGLDVLVPFEFFYMHLCNVETWKREAWRQLQLVMSVSCYETADEGWIVRFAGRA